MKLKLTCSRKEYTVKRTSKVRVKEQTHLRDTQEVAQSVSKPLNRACHEKIKLIKSTKIVIGWMKDLEVTEQLAESQREPGMHDAVNQL